MEIKLSDEITYYRNPIYDIADVIRSKGYFISDGIGMRVDVLSDENYNTIGILKPREPIEKNFLGIKWYKKQIAYHIGTLKLNDNKKESDKNWTLEVYGENHVSELAELVRELSKPEDIKISIELGSEQPKYEFHL